MAKSRNIDFEQMMSTGGTSDKQEVLKELMKVHDNEFAMAMQDMWYFSQFIKTFDEENEKIRMFPHYPYLIDVNNRVDKYKRVIVCKSRRMLLSWLGVLRQFWRAMRAGTSVEGTKDVFYGGIMSVGEVEATHLMDRIRALHQSLPLWLTSRNPMVMNNQMEIRFRDGGKIRAFPLKREGPRTFGFTEVFFDEMAFQEVARKVWMGMTPALGARGIVLAVSTPNGEDNLFADIWFNKENRYSDIHRVPFLANTMNPEHGPDWLKLATRGMDKQMIAREFYGSFAAYAGQPVWDTFEKPTHVWDLDKAPMNIVEEVPVYIGWDLGYHYPAAIIAQRNSRDQWLFFKEIQGEDIDFSDFCDRVLQICNSLYKRDRVEEILCMPPDAKFRYHNKSLSGAVNDIGQVKITFTRKGRPPQVRLCPGEVGTRNNEAPRLKEVRKLWKLRGDGRPGIMIHPGMNIFIEGCLSGYCYPETGDSEQPEKTKHSHLQDAAQAIVSAYAKMTSSQLPKADTIKPRPRINLRSGRN